MSQACVLIVDDEPINLVLLESLLEDVYQVLSAGSGQQALALCQSHPGQVDVILSDVMMPEMDGHALCRQLKAQPQTRDIPVLLVSSLNREADDSAGLQAGAADLIAKPYSPDVLLARVRTHVRLRKLTQLAKAQGWPLSLEMT